MPGINHDEQIAVLDQRVTKIEASVTHIEAAVSKLARGFDEFQKLSKPNISVLITAAGFVVACGGGLWALAIRPIEQQSAILTTGVTDNRRRVEVMEQDQVRLAERSEVLRTRMEGAEALGTQRDQYNWIFLQLMWKKAMGDELPSKDVWPTITRPGEMGVGPHTNEAPYSGR